MMCSLRLSRFASVLVSAILLLTAPINSSAAQQLALSASVGREVFFEGEPIYVVLQLTNAGPDTAWTWFFEITPDGLDLTLQRPDSSVVPKFVMWIDRIFSTEWRGVPIAAGERQYLLLPLQSSLGESGLPGSAMFNRKIVAGSYTLGVRFHASVNRPTTLPDLVATPLRIEVRARTPDEDRSFSEVERLMSEGWDRNTRPGFVSRLTALIKARVARDSLDPFAPFLVNEAVTTASAWGLPLSSTDSVDLRAARLTIARSQRFLPSGAMVAVALVFDPESPKDLASQLGPSLAGEIATWQAQRRRRSGPIIRPSDR
jgi:hypothetical protein